MKSVDYKMYEEYGGFGRIQELLDKKKMSGISLVCATGVWLLYKEGYGSEKTDEVRILAGKDTSVSPGASKSVVAVQYYADIKIEQLTPFNGGRNPYESVIAMGESSWTIVTASKTFCVKPGETGEFPDVVLETFALEKEGRRIGGTSYCGIWYKLESTGVGSSYNTFIQNFSF